MVYYKKIAMGGCCDGGISKRIQEDQVKKALQKQIEAADANRPYEYRIILLGTGTYIYTLYIEKNRNIYIT